MKQLPARFFVRTPSVELFVMVQEELFKLGYFWFPDKLKRNQYWDSHKEETCIGVNQEVEKNTSIFYAPHNYYLNENIQEVSIADLVLFKSVQTKELKIKEIPWKIEIGEKVVIGCCTFEKEELKKTLEEIWNHSPESRSRQYYITRYSIERKLIHLYEGRLGLDIWVDQKFETTVSWNAVEKLMAEL